MNAAVATTNQAAELPSFAGTIELGAGPNEVSEERAQDETLAENLQDVLILLDEALAHMVSGKCSTTAEVARVRDLIEVAMERGRLFDVRVTVDLGWRLSPAVTCGRGQRE